MSLCHHLEHYGDITLDIMWQFKGFSWLEFECTKSLIFHEGHKKLVTGQHLTNNFVDATLKIKAEKSN